MKSNLRLGHISLDGIREIGGFGQPLHALYPQIRAVLSFEFGPDAAYLLAEPVVDRSKNRIDWYAEGDPDEKPIPLADVSAEEQQSIVAGVEEVLNRGRQLAERYSSSEDTHRAQIGAILKAVFTKSAETEIFIINGKPVMTGWGFSTDTPWNLSPSSERQVIEASERASTTAEAIIADSVTTEPSMMEAKPPVSLQASTSDIAQESELPPAVSTSGGAQPQPIDEVAAVASDSPALVTPPQPARLRERAVSGDKQTLDSAPTVTSASLRHYVVVGSRYFWSVVGLALLALLLAIAWVLLKERTPLTERAVIPTAMTNAKFDERLAQLQQEETKLRGQFEKLLVRLASQRGQCQLQPDFSGAVPKPLAPAQEVQISEATPSDAGRGVLIKPSSDPASVNPTPSPPAETAPSGQNATSVVLAQSGPGESVPPARNLPKAERQPSVLVGSVTHPAQIPAPPITPEVARTAEEAAPTNALTPPSSAPLSASTQTPAAVVPMASPIPPTAPTAVATAKDAVLPGSKSHETAPGQTLEEALAEQNSPAPAPTQISTPAKPPVKAEPTAEERREFANRMSATGATSGEITATLLWNGGGDLDLVVRCPSGRHLDFRNTSECGGTLDVDANSVRSGLKERPVENAFWPAGKAVPGVYEVGVRYVPRKDEDAPQETPFQVRLSRGGQETVFKGTVRPNAVVPVTTFNVQR
jgi:hypothetical protein